MNKLLIFLLSMCVTSLEAATITNWGAQLPTAVPASGDVILMQKGGVTYYFTPNQLATQLSTNANLTVAGSDSNALYSLIIANGATTSNGLFLVETTRNGAVSNGAVTLVIGTSNTLYTTETTRNAAVSNAVIAEIIAYDGATSNALYTTETTRNAAVSNAVVALIGGGSSNTVANLNGLATNTAFYGATTNGGALYGNAAWLTNLPSLQVSLPFNPTNSALIGDGDSLMVNLFPVLTNSVTGWRQFGAISNFAESGLVMAGLINHWETNVAPAIAVMKTAGLTNIYLLVDIGANNIYETTVDFTATLLSWSNYMVRARSSNVIIVTFTILPQYLQENQRILNWNAGNYYIRRSALPDYLIDWARLLPLPTDTTLYTDGIHPNAVGNLRVAQSIDATLRGWVRDRPDATAQSEYNTNIFWVADGTVVGTLNKKGLVITGTTNNISGDLFIGTDVNSRIKSPGWLNVGGPAVPKSPLHVGVASDNYESQFGNAVNIFGADDGTHAQVAIFSTTAAATSKGARLLLGGRNTSGGGTTSPYPYVFLDGKSEGAAAYNGYFAISTSQSDSDIRERMRITSAGWVSIGSSVPSSSLDVTGQVRSASAIFTNSVTVVGTTNQLIFGNTNPAPASAVSPTKWISVRVTGEAGLYRIPLYE